MRGGRVSCRDVFMYKSTNSGVEGRSNSVYARAVTRMPTVR